MPLGIRGRGAENRLALLATATGHARALAAAADIDIDLAPHLSARVRHITATFTASLHALDHHTASGTTTATTGTWTRVSPLIRALESLLQPPPGPRATRLHTALHELAALDEALAAYAEQRGLTLTSATPTPPATQETAPARTPLDRRTQTALAAWAARNQQPVPAGPHAPSRTRPAAHAPTARHPHSPPGPGTGTRRSHRHRHPPPPHGHPGGCDAWITLVNARGKRRAAGRATGGRYRILDLPPGSYTVIASGSARPPRAEFLSIRQTTGELRHDIELERANRAERG